jgi:hypothetical protein
VPTTFGTVASVAAAVPPLPPSETVTSMWSPRFAVVPGFFACATMVPLG